MTANAPYASRVVTTTPFQRDTLIGEYGVDAQKVVLIPHGVDSSLFRPAEKSEEDRMRIVFLGRLEDTTKGVYMIPNMLAVMERSGVPYLLDIVGDGVDRAGLEHKLSKRMERGAVRFHGKLRRQDIPPAIGGSDVYIFPSLHEGFGFTLLEAMACGLVPVASRLPGVTDFIIREGESGILCPPGDARSFAEAVIGLHKDRGLLEEMSAMARKEASSRFSLDKFGRSYADLFDEVFLEPPLEWSRRTWRRFEVCPPCRPTLSSRLPGFIKPSLRKIRSMLTNLSKARTDAGDG